MAESVEDRLDYVESELISAGDITVKFRDIAEALELISGVLHDIVKDGDSAPEYAADIQRIADIARFLPTR